MEKNHNIEESERARKALLSLIEDQKETLAKLKESESLFRTLSESTSTAIFIYKNEKFIYVNSATERLTGYSSAELLTMNFWDIVHPDFKEIVKQRGLARQRGENVPNRYEFKLKKKDGSEVWVDFSAGKIIWAGESAAIGSAVDITERKLAEEALEYERNLIKTVFNEIPAAIWIKDVNGRKIYANKFELNLCGKNSEEEIIGKTDFEIYDEKTAQKYTEEDRIVLEKGESLLNLEGKFIKPNGKELNLIGAKVPLKNNKNEIVGIVGINNDITEKVTLTNILQQQKNLLEAKNIVGDILLNTSDPDEAINKALEYICNITKQDRCYIFEFHKDQKTEKVLFSQRYEYSKENVRPTINDQELQNADVFELMPRWYKLFLENAIVVGNVKDFPQLEYEILSAQNIVSLLCVPIFIKGNLWGFIGLDNVREQFNWSEFDIDILRASGLSIGMLILRKDAEYKLKKSEERYALVIEAVEQGLWDWDVLKNEVYFSPQWKRQIGYLDNELENKFSEWVEHLHPEDKERCLAAVDDYLKNPKGLFELEFRFRHKNGNYRYIFNKAASVLDDNGKVIRLFGAHSDITDAKLKQLEIIEQTNRQKAFQNILVETATSELIINGEVTELAKLINEKISKRLNIARVSVWLLNESETILECVDLYEKNKDLHSSGYQLFTEEYKNEFDALINSKYVDASNPYTDPRTKGYVENYLTPNNITSMLDCVINYSGKNFGTLCLEHVNKQHTWQSDETSFGCQIADQIAICLSNRDKIIAEKKLKESEKLYRLIADNSSNVITVLDFELRFTYVSPSIQKLLGYQPEELINNEAKNLFPHESFLIVQKTFQEELELEKQKGELPYRSRIIIAEEFHKDGYKIWVEITGSFLRDENGNAIGILASTTDITERKRLEDQLVKSEEKYRLIAENTADTISVFDLDFNYTYISPSVIKLLGYTPEELMKLGIGTIIKAEYLDYFKKLLIEELEHEKKPNIDLNRSRNVISEQIRKDGSIIWVEATVSFIRNENNEPIGILSVNRDITERINLLDQLKKSEERMRLFVEGTSYFFFYTHDTNGMVTYISPSVEKITGYTQKEWLNQNHWFITDSPINEKAIERTRNILNGKKEKNPVYLEIYNSKHEKILLEIYEVPIYYGSYITGIQGIAHDVTERNRLYESIRILSRAIHQSPLSVVVTDLEGKVKLANPRFTETTGYSFEEVENRKTSFLRSGYHNQDFYKNLWETILSGKVWQGEIYNKKKDGSYFWENIIISPVTNDEGSITNFIAIKEDITLKKELNDKIIRSENELREIWKSSIDAMRLIDENGIILNVNDAYCKLFGVEREKLLGREFNVSYIITDDNKSLDHFRERFKARQILPEFETKVTLHSGEERWIELTNSFVDISKEKSMLLSIFRDITERKNLIHDLIEAKQKAEASEKLTSDFLAQVSHEIRSPLNVILNNTSLLQFDFEELTPEEKNDIFAGITNSSQRIIRTVDLILNSSEMQLGTYNPIFKKVDLLQNIAEKAYKEFRHYADGRGLELRFNSSVDKAEIVCDEYSVYQSLVNLVDNAIKYTKQGYIEIKVLRNAKKKFQIEVTDTGIGISDEYQKHLFEPFTQEETGYTRKFEGTGLGLSLVKKYCELNNIDIQVESKKGVGTTFRMVFLGKKIKV